MPGYNHQKLNHNNNNNNNDDDNNNNDNNHHHHLSSLMHILDSSHRCAVRKEEYLTPDIIKIIIIKL